MQIKGPQTCFEHWQVCLLSWRLLVQSKGPFTQAIFVAQLDAIFIALWVALHNSASKPPAILSPQYCQSFDATQQKLQGVAQQKLPV